MTSTPTIGKHGIEVVGATRRLRLDLVPEPASSNGTAMHPTSESLSTRA
jgi:hypothetical protein